MVKQHFIGKQIADRDGIMYTIIDADFGAESDIENACLTITNGTKTRTISLSFVFEHGKFTFDEELASEIQDELDRLNCIKEVEAKRDINRYIIHPNSADDSNSKDSTIYINTKSFLSNEWSCHIEYNGHVYTNADAAYQAQKNPNSAKDFMYLNGFQARMAGSSVIPTLKDWNEKKIEIMEDVLYAKFIQNPSLQFKLLATENKPIINLLKYDDKFWGVYNGIGQNQLGKLLMKVRTRIIEEIKKFSLGKTFSTRVIDFFKDKKYALVEGINKNRYKVALSPDKSEVLLLDQPFLQPIPISVFDEVERCIDKGIISKGNARARVGSEELDEETIMYHLAKNVYCKDEGDSMFDAACYIFAILNAARCTIAEKGSIRKI